MDAYYRSCRRWGSAGLLSFLAFNSACTDTLIQAGFYVPVVPPPRSHSSGSEPRSIEPFAVMPRIATDDEPMKFIGLTSEEKALYEKQRREWNERRTQQIEARADRVPIADIVGGCIVGTLIIFSPLCLFIVPMLAGDRKGQARTAAMKEFKYMPALPSDKDFAAVYERI